MNAIKAILGSIVPQAAPVNLRTLRVSSLMATLLRAAMPKIGDVPLFVEHCEAAVAEVDVTRRWLDEQGRRELSFSFDVLAERHGVPEVACAPSIVGSLLRLPPWPPRSSAGPSRPIAIASRCGRRDARCS